jgi:hypothetical protein
VLVPTLRGRAFDAVSVAVAALLGLDAAANARRFLVEAPRLQRADQSLEASQGRLLQWLGPSTRVRFVGRSWVPLKREVARLAAPDVLASTLFNPAGALPVRPDGRDLAFVLYDDEYVYLPVLRAVYPEGVVRDLVNPDGALVCRVLVVPARAARRAASRDSGCGLLSSAGRVDPFIGFGTFVPEPADDPESLPIAPFSGDVAVVWRGEVLTERRTYDMRLRADGLATLRVDDRTLVFDGVHAPAQGVDVQPGWHPVRIEFRPRSPESGIEWIWSRPDGSEEIVPPSALRPRGAMELAATGTTP